MDSIQMPRRNTSARLAAAFSASDKVLSISPFNWKMTMLVAWRRQAEGYAIQAPLPILEARTSVLVFSFYCDEELNLGAEQTKFAIS